MGICQAEKVGKGRAYIIKHEKTEVWDYPVSLWEGDVAPHNLCACQRENDGR